MDRQIIRIGATTLQDVPCVLPAARRAQALAAIEELEGGLIYLGLDDIHKINPRLRAPAFEGHYVALPDGDGLVAYGGVDSEDAVLWLFLEWFCREDAA